jgi:UPF0176 protein
MKSILNIAAYLFVSLDGLPELRAKMLDECNARQLKGTILLTGEGINLFLAGKAEELRGFLDWLRTDARFKPLTAKESWSEDQPFKKMLIKLKNEIIRMNHPMIRPETGRANFISPKKLQEWLDRGTDDLGRPVVMVDTRNAFEVEYGTFENALHFNIEKFTEFPAAITAHKEELADKTHNVEVRPSGTAVVNIDAAHRGVGTASCGPDTLPQYLVGGGTYTFNWTVRSI